MKKLSMAASLRGRLRNTSLAPGHGLAPLFEAVVNSIHSIEELPNPLSGKIEIEIHRSAQSAIGVDETDENIESGGLRDIIGFTVEDNGVGFNSKNLESFLTFDSEYKAHKGCRGVGRLLWLKAFAKVSIASTYVNEKNELVSISLLFTADNGVKELSEVPSSEPSARKTTIQLQGFKEEYRTHVRKRPRIIANSLIEHCLWFFLRSGGAPDIHIKDGDEYIYVNDMFEKHMVTTSKREEITIKGEQFDILHMKLRSGAIINPSIVYGAANRQVCIEKLTGKIPGLYGRLEDEQGTFVYSCYITSKYLDEWVRPERTSFEIPETITTGDVFDKKSISFSEIRNGVVGSSTAFLDSFLQTNKESAKKRVNDFVARKAPRYRPILSRIPEEELMIDPLISDKELDLLFHKHLYDIEAELLSEGHDILSKAVDQDFPQYSELLDSYLKKAEDIKKSDLASYVSHRRVIIDLLDKAIQRTPEGKYSREDVIHRLIMPMGVDMNQVLYDDCNLWLIDERLAFHHYLASDKTLNSMPVTGSNETKEPDLFALNLLDNPLLVSESTHLPLASIVIVEIKKPMRNDMGTGEDKDPIEQALGYLNRIRKGGVMTATGRPIPDSQNIPGFCYVIADRTPTMVERCEMHSAQRSNDGLGYFFYHDTYKAYVEVIFYEGLVNSAKERNKAFFDKLGLPAT